MINSILLTVNINIAAITDSFQTTATIQHHRQQQQQQSKQQLYEYLSSLWGWNLPLTCVACFVSVFQRIRRKKFWRAFSTKNFSIELWSWHLEKGETFSWRKKIKSLFLNSSFVRLFLTICISILCVRVRVYLEMTSHLSILTRKDIGTCSKAFAKQLYGTFRKVLLEIFFQLNLIIF